MLLALTDFVAPACNIEPMHKSGEVNAEVYWTFAAHSLLPARLPQNPLAPEMLNALLTAAKKKFANQMAFRPSQPLYIMKGHHKALR
jgi:hypothetical protein